MVEFGFAICVGVEEAKVNDPELVCLRVNVDAGDNPDTFDDAFGVAAVLAAHPLNGHGVVLVRDGVIEEHIAIGRSDQGVFNLLPDQARRELVLAQEAVELVMTVARAVVSSTGCGQRSW